MIQKRIAIIGQQCSGKTTVAETISQGFEDPRLIKFADPIYGALGVMRQEKHRAFMQDFGEMVKRHFGEHVFVDIFKKRVNHEHRFEQALICDDVRRDYEAEACVDMGFKIIYVTAPVEIRKARAEAQGLEFIENHISETQVPSLAKYANVGIINSGSAEGLKRDIGKALDSIYLPN